MEVQLDKFKAAVINEFKSSEINIGVKFEDLKDYSKPDLLKALFYGLEEAYKSEVIDTGMKEHMIGEDKDYNSKREWQLDHFRTWLEGWDI